MRLPAPIHSAPPDPDAQPHEKPNHCKNKLRGKKRDFYQCCFLQISSGCPVSYLHYNPAQGDPRACCFSPHPFPAQSPCRNYVADSFIWKWLGLSLKRKHFNDFFDHSFSTFLNNINCPAISATNIIV